MPQELHPDPALSTKSRAIARQRAELAAKGFYKCMGKCGGVYPLPDGIVVTWGGNVMLAVCPNCFPETPVILRRHPRGIQVKVQNDVTRPVDLIVASDMTQVGEFVSEKSLSKFKKIEEL